MSVLSKHLPTQTGSAKALSLISAPGTAVSGYNISSLTDVGTGINDHNFAAAMANANYLVNTCLGRASSTINFRRVVVYEPAETDTGSVRTESGYASGATAVFEDNQISVSVHGDIA